MITIQAESVAELRNVFLEMFGPTFAAAGKDLPIKTAVTKPATKKAEPKQEEPPVVEPPGTVTVEVPEETGRTATYEEVIALVKKLKASTVPDILDKVNAWKTSGGYPALKESSPEQLGTAMNFIESLEG